MFVIPREASQRSKDSGEVKHFAFADAPPLAIKGSYFGTDFRNPPTLVGGGFKIKAIQTAVGMHSLR